MSEGDEPTGHPDRSKPSRPGMPDRPRGRERHAPKGSTVALGQAVVAVVGYPNVGKSTLFNRLTGRREAVVDSRPGATRDRRQGGAEWNGVQFQILDTGGIDDADESSLARDISSQAVRAIDEADLILFVVDAMAGATAGDLEVAERLRRSHRPVIVVANKCDNEDAEIRAQSLWGLGLGEVVTVSALHGRGVGDFLDLLVESLPEIAVDDDEGDDAVDRMPAFCIMGRPNVGKSSILNALLGEERMIVQDQPGTTRDPVDTIIEWDGQEIVLIDTAGLRRRGRMRERVEHYSQLRAIEAAHRADVAIVVADATEGITEADLAACDQAAQAHCATLLILNKWDLATPDLTDLRGRVRRKSRQHPPIVACSAVTSEGLDRVIPAALRLFAKSRNRLSTHDLNTTLRALAAERPGPRKGNRQLSMRFLVQTGVAPPIFRLEVNDRALMTRDYGFWLENRIRDRFDLAGVPVDIEVRSRR
ncbi:MAG: ribosome biogenesis GTPase Der [Thermoleophilia bacterium]|nr:ribosome biogenesis GTPase Der [Thermoleophilia bacterium]